MKRISLILILLLFPALFICIACSNNPDINGEDDVEKSAKKINDQRGIPVEAMVVRTDIIEENVPLTGILQPIHSVNLIAEVSGQITRINAQLGQYITKRDTLAVIDDEVAYSNYRQAQSQVLSAQNNLKIAELNLKSDKHLYENGDISKLAYENSRLAVKNAQASLLSAKAGMSLMKKTFFDTRIVSPINGFISRKEVELGTMINQGQMVFRVVDLSRLKVFVGVPQGMIDRVSLGSTANINISALNDMRSQGIVKHISPQADEESGAFTAEIHVKNTPEMSIRAGMTARIDLIVSQKTPQVSIPDYSLVTREGNEHVYKISNGEAVLTDISIAEKIGSVVVIADGLTHGDTIVSVGMKNLGVRTKVWIEKLYQ